MSHHRKQDWFVLNVRKFFTAVEEVILVNSGVSQKQGTTINAGFIVESLTSVNINCGFRLKPFCKNNTDPTKSA